MAEATEIRAGLERAAKDRAAADWHKEKATDEAVELMRLIPETEGISMKDAAEILDVSRVMAYKMLKD